MAEAPDGSSRSSRARSTHAPRRPRPPLRQVALVCLPGAGGPALAEAIRSAAADGAVELRLHLVGPETARAPMLIGDPLTGVFWPVPPPSAGVAGTSGEGGSVDDDVEAAEELRRRAQQLWWLCWEMGFDAVCEPTSASAVDALLDAVASRCDLVVVAGADTRRWRATMRMLARQAQRCGTEVRLAHDRPPGPLLRWLAR